VNRTIEDVTMMYLTFRKNRCAFIQNSWLDPKKVRQMTVVGSRRMIVYDDTEPLEKLKIYDARVEVPPHYDSFAEFTYSYHYGDAYVPYIKQDEPLKLECQHFLDCIRGEAVPITGGIQGLEVVRILEASNSSLRQQGQSISLGLPAHSTNGEHAHHHANGKSNGHNGNGNGNGNGHGHGIVVPAGARSVLAA
jgi:predicted dehydrogenase